EPTPLHRAELDDDAPVADRQAREAVATASNGDGQTVALRELDRRADVRDARAARDQGRVAVDRTVPDPPRVVVAGVGRANDLAAKGCFELVDCRFVQLQHNN